MKIVSFIIQKGGCGKTTTTVNTAGYLALNGFKLLCVDMDPQGNLTQHFGYDSESLDKTLLHLFQKTASFQEVVLKRDEFLHILPNNIDTAAAETTPQKSMSREYLLRDVLSAVSNEYDFVFIDCPPTLGLFSINALAASHEFILVVSPEFFPMKAIKPLYETYRTVKYRLNHSLQFNGIMMTMCDFRTRHSQEVLQILKKNFPHKLYNSYIRNNVSLKEAASYGQTIFEYNPASVGAFDYQNFSEEFIRDHHKNRVKRDYYQRKFESLPPNQQKQILTFAQQNLSLFIRNSMEKLPESTAVQEAFLIERNRVVEKLFPYRTDIFIESSP
jgi:chromosome partitioning protein